MDEFPYLHVRRGLHISRLSLVWTGLASSLAIIVGFSTANLSLTAFGFIGVVDTLATFVLVAHFRHSLRLSILKTHNDQLVERIVIIGMSTVALLTIADSIFSVLTGKESSPSLWGLAIALLSALALGAIAYFEFHIGSIIPSGALVSAAWFSASSAGLAVMVVIGTVLSYLGMPWADPLLASIMSLVALYAAKRLHSTPDVVAATTDLLSSE